MQFPDLWKIGRHLAAPHGYTNSDRVDTCITPECVGLQKSAGARGGRSRFQSLSWQLDPMPRCRVAGSLIGLILPLSNE